MNCTDDLRFALKAYFPAMIPHYVYIRIGITTYVNELLWAFL